MYANDDLVPAPSACMMLQYSAAAGMRVNHQARARIWLPKDIHAYAHLVAKTYTRTYVDTNMTYTQKHGLVAKTAHAKHASPPVRSARGVGAGKRH
jgi:hypothetical protein